VSGTPFQSINNAAVAGHGSTVFVTKLNATGKALVYSTYLGGSGSGGGGDFGYGIALDSQNHAYVTGATYSTDFPVTCGALQTGNESASGATTAFVAKLSQAGSNLMYSTYLGGGSPTSLAVGDVAEAIAVDKSGDAYVAGYTFSSNFPVTEGAFQAEKPASTATPNAFVSELNPVATALVYSTFLGGNASDYANAIALNASGNAYVTGNTDSSNFPVTTGAFQTTPHGSTAFVTEFNPTGTDQVYSTFLGGSGGDVANAIVVDRGGFAYVAGTTYSNDFPVTAAVLEGSDLENSVIFAYGASVGFVTKLSPDGSALEYSTYLEGFNSSVSSLAADSTGAAYVAGSAVAASGGDTAGFQTTPDALPTPLGGTSAFLVKLDPAATALNYATLVGGDSNDSAIALAIDSARSVYLTGYAYSNNFPTTSGAFQTASNGVGGADNVFVSKFALVAEDNQTAYPSPPTGPIPTSMTIVSEVIQCQPPSPGYELTVTVSLNTSGVTGPPPTGTIEFNSGAIVNENGFFNGAWGGSTQVAMYGDTAGGYGPVPPQGWAAYYPGDVVYQGSSLSGLIYPPAECAVSWNPFSGQRVNSNGAQFAPVMSGALGKNQSIAALNSTLPVSRRAVATPAKPTLQGPKFIPPADIQPIASNEFGQNLPPAPSLVDSSAPTCLAPYLTLTVTLHPATRIYGVANPTFSPTLTGLISGQSVVVTPQTTATPASPVGVYPVTATVSGPDAANYTITVVGTTLDVTKAPLHIVAKTIDSTYGHTPAQPNAYSLVGFANGDTARVVTGAPVLTTNVTSATPVGFYQIGVAVGTLSAANYFFETIASGMGVVGVYKAPLAIVAGNEVVTYGQAPAPPAAYTLTGFVNGDTASVVSGAPVLSTKVTSTTPVGFYKIGVQVGTLTATNYYFDTFSNGEGSVGVYRAPLEITVNTITMTQGSLVSPLTYTLTGFVNGDTQATAVTGAAVLSTTATSASTPGDYPITFSLGTLAAKNYSFSGGRNGVLRVLP
jgi:hypothetical protein